MKASQTMMNLTDGSESLKRFFFVNKEIVATIGLIILSAVGWGALEIYGMNADIKQLEGVVSSIESRAGEERAELKQELKSDIYNLERKIHAFELKIDARFDKIENMMSAYFANQQD